MTSTLKNADSLNWSKPKRAEKHKTLRVDSGGYPYSPPAPYSPPQGGDPLEENKSPGVTSPGSDDSEASTRRGPASKDYKFLAAEYKQQEAYRQLAGNQRCVVCRQNACDHVFFPCQHKCVCRQCISSENFGPSARKVTNHGVHAFLEGEGQPVPADLGSAPFMSGLITL